MSRLLIVLAALGAALPCVSVAVPGARLPGQYLSAPDSAQLFPFVDLAHDTTRQVVVDRDPAQYLGHPSTVLLEDGRTMLCVYPKGHGKGALVLKRSTDGGLTWSDRLPVPENWSTSQETPSIHRVIDAAGRKRLIVWSGLYPARLSISENDGATWTPLTPAGHWGGIVVMGSVAAVRGAPGHYLAWFNDDGRYIKSVPQHTKQPVYKIYQTASADGGVTWDQPHAIESSLALLLCEPGFVRSPDGLQIALLLREDSHQHFSQVIFSNDEGHSWTAPRPLSIGLIGDRHVAAYGPDGRLIVVFRDTNRTSPTNGDWCAWVGTYADLVQGGLGQYRVRLAHNTWGWDSGYSGLECLPDGTLVATSYGHWAEAEEPYILSVRFKLSELDARLGSPEHPAPSARVK
ncbi:MAG: sialidase family protein [Opitutaceae bacterium]